MTTETRHEVRPRGDQTEPKKYRSNVRPAPYRIPAAPPIAWAPGNSKRRAWLSRFVLSGLLVMQAILTLRLRNSVYPGETSILPSNGDFHGGTGLYPALSESLQAGLGVQGMRFLSLVFMICATGLLYSWSTRLFNERVGLAAAGAHSVIAPTLVAGALATEDALAIFLLAGTVWLVALSRTGPVWPLFAAVPVAVLAVVVKFGSVFYLPFIVLLALLVTARHTSVGQAVLRSSGLVVALLVGVGLFATGGSDGAPAAVGFGDLFSGWAHWLGAYLAVGLFGAGFYVWKARMGEVPVGADPEPGRGWRVALSAAFLLPVVLAPVFLAFTTFEGSLWRLQFGFAGLFGATMVGVGLVRMIGRHFRFPQVGIIAAVGLLALGMAQSEYEYTLWPNYDNIAKVLDQSVEPSKRYLGSAPETFGTYMEEFRTAQWTATDKIVTKDLERGGLAELKAVLRKRTYEMIVVQIPTVSPTDEALLEQLRAGTGDYRVLTGVPFRLGWTEGTHQIWVKNLRPAVP
ncbi:glycosyltransferase family 39 protein [Actinocorallia sp. API 0066]|uniref:glycosyltransferase family 39 protein n=1 Tax=Actinocorallia sp. API 0066 TaxID=2896846 RepID=UPI001E5D2AD0|nr:glycosyltransferase family 39 protein [Actinocorallia sp. API 0066]MCD0451153.1 glycosyltransferase family 39 protein [Actinocorallia sp. API 0066]